MTELEKLKNDQPYYGNDEELQNHIIKIHDLCHNYNSLMPSNLIEKDKILKEILGKKGNDVTVLQPFRCDFGFNIEIGNNSFINMNAMILDSAKVIIGNNVFIGPNLSIATPIHPLEIKQRNMSYEWAKKVIIEDDVWIGANVLIMPGVKIHKGCVIGAGSIVTKDMDSNKLCYGSPCKEMKNINN